MSSCARSQRSRPGRASRPRRGWSARTPMSSRRAGLDCGTRADESAGRARRVAHASVRRERFGRFGSREEIRVESRRQQEIGAIVAVLDLDPDRLNRPLRERDAVHGGALVGRQNRGRHPHAAVDARHGPALVVELLPRATAARLEAQPASAPATIAAASLRLTMLFISSALLRQIGGRSSGSLLKG